MRLGIKTAAEPVAQGFGEGIARFGPGCARAGAPAWRPPYAAS